MPERQRSSSAVGERTETDPVRAELERRAVELARVKQTVSTADSTEFVLFRVRSESYGVVATSVSGVFKLNEMALVPGAPAFVRGLTLAKGQILPLLDLGVLLGTSAVALSDLASVVALGPNGGKFGLLADAIEGIRAVASDKIRPPPREGENGRSPYVAGMTDDAVLLLDADALLSLFNGGKS